MIEISLQKELLWRPHARDAPNITGAVRTDKQNNRFVWAKVCLREGGPAAQRMKALKLVTGFKGHHTMAVQLAHFQFKTINAVAKGLWLCPWLPNVSNDCKETRKAKKTVNHGESY